MNRWAVHHTHLMERDLQEGEQLLCANRVVLVGASSVATWTGSSPPSGRAARVNPAATRRFAPHQMKLSVARQLGFPLPGWIFAIGLSNRRLLFWRTSSLLANPQELTAALPLDVVASIQALRRVGATRVSVVLGDGGMLAAQALWSRNLADLAGEFNRVRASGGAG